ncbi:hypothetical protein [Haloarchaeobius sp. DFWS5]|uniref:hypothetical protein n=1 Tax=Haloarchaeobius sp. DFWS5 TaxID=3446114 RepID=UPI003EBF7062
MTTKRYVGVISTDREPPVLPMLVGGLAGGVVMGLLLQYSTETMTMVGGLAGQESVTMGWLVHLLLSLVFAIVFGLVLTYTPMHRYLASTLAVGALGMTYSIGLWFVGAGVLMPMWLDSMGVMADPTIPALDGMGLLVHLVYGLVLAGAYMLAYVRSQPEPSKLTGQA